MSIEKTIDNKPVVIVENNILDGVPKKDWIKTVKQTISDKFSSGIPISGRLIKVNAITKNEFTKSKYSQFLRATDGTIYADKFKSANNLDEILLATTNYVNEDLKHLRKDKIKEFARGDVLIRVGNNDYSAKVIVGFTGTNMLLYDIVEFTPTNFTIKKRIHQEFGESRTPRNDVSSNTNISQKDNGVNSSISEKSKNDTDIPQMNTGEDIDGEYMSAVKNGGISPSVLYVICGLSNAAYVHNDGVFVVPITALKEKITALKIFGYFSFKPKYLHLLFHLSSKKSLDLRDFLRFVLFIVQGFWYNSDSRKPKLPKRSSIF